MEINELNPLRVNLIDAEFLDLEVRKILKNQIINIFQFFPIDLNMQYDTETETFLNSLFYASTILQNIQTPGALLLNVHFVDRTTGSSSLSIVQRVCYLLGSTIYIWRQTLNNWLLKQSQKKKKNEFLEHLEICWKILSFFQLLYFIRFGGPRNLLERIINIQLVIKDTNKRRMIIYEPMNHQLFWESLTNFLFFLFPLINFKKINSFVTIPFQLIGLFNKSDRNLEALELKKEKCPNCEEKHIAIPIEANCGCTYCYYCLYSNLLETASIRCLHCNTLITSGKPKSW